MHFLNIQKMEENIITFQKFCIHNFTCLSHNWYTFVLNLVQSEVPQEVMTMGNLLVFVYTNFDSSSSLSDTDPNKETSDSSPLSVSLVIAAMFCLCTSVPFCCHFQLPFLVTVHAQKLVYLKNCSSYWLEFFGVIY